MSIKSAQPFVIYLLVCPEITVLGQTVTQHSHYQDSSVTFPPVDQIDLHTLEFACAAIFFGQQQIAG